MSIAHLSFCCRQDAERARPNRSTAVVSITDAPPDGAPAKLRRGWHSVLRLEFADIDPDKLRQSPILLQEVLTRYPPMTSEHAVKMVDFVKLALAGGATSLLIHCEAGISRSAAVAKWIADWYGLHLSDEAVEKHNRHVYRLLMEAARGGV